MLSLTAVVMALAVLAGACGSGESSSDLPRTTELVITITATESVETLQLPGCNTYWWTRGEEPPPGACERDTTVRRFTARHDTGEVETLVVGEVVVDPLYAMQLVARQLTEGVSVVVVVPPSTATVVQLTDSSGQVVDRVAPSDRLVAVAGFGPDLTVEALSAGGLVIAACPPDGVILDRVVYVCTFAPGAAIPITTTTLDDAPTP